MKSKFIKYIEDNKLIEKGDNILVALSGGPDSICMLHLLCSIRDEYDLKIGAAHLNHMLRGEEANKDEEFAKEFCNKLNVDFYSERVDIEAYSKEQGVSTETGGRDVRYGLFNKVSQNDGYNKIATAHNANDQAETILMRMMRGTGLEGLCGIPIIREGKYIRPILCMERWEVEKYCEDFELHPRIDKTNLETVYSRNKIRLEILPYMKEHFNKDVVMAINRMTNILWEDNKFINDYCKEKFKEYCVKENGNIKIKEELFKESKAIITRVIRKALTKVSKSTYDFELKHVEEVIKLSKIGTNKRIDLPNNIYAENVYGQIYIKKKEKEKIINNIEITIEKEKLDGYKIEFNGYELNFEIVQNRKNLKIADNDLIKYFDCDKIKKYVVIRTRKNGDKITPMGMSGSKKLKDIFIDMKIPKDKREELPIIVFDDNISWVLDVKLSNIYKVTKETDNILKIIYKRKV
ncbi:tRNA lysidine(34) synthetase TilS [uncultured Clostridium sp.]|uniref:tRNA lysidine(34) synthetase TilS n=1 Tax=uncultured Clostridium sp. TaxID=59620 RepID=UPI00260DFD52|nr:tRNA lysidine(34) synthetase TilS [uncultured Clostridium sp.]